jgi:hypothetical protein
MAPRLERNSELGLDTSDSASRASALSVTTNSSSLTKKELRNVASQKATESQRQHQTARQQGEVARAILDRTSARAAKNATRSFNADKMEEPNDVPRRKKCTGKDLTVEKYHRNRQQQVTRTNGGARAALLEPCTVMPHTANVRRPNPWNLFQHLNAGKGWSIQKMSTEYRAFKEGRCAQTLPVAVPVPVALVVELSAPVLTPVGVAPIRKINAWNLFQQQNAGKGWSPAKMAQEYRNQ